MSCSIRRMASRGSSRFKNPAISATRRKRVPGGLVEQEDRRIAGEAENDLDLPLLPVREIADLDVAAVPVTGVLQEPAGLRVHVGVCG